MNYLEKLRQFAQKNNSIVCMGLDPVVEAMPEVFSKQGISGFILYFEHILDEMKEQKVFPGAFKPNQGFYLKHDRPRDLRSHHSGTAVLSIVMALIEQKLPNTPIILDYKRGDIAKSSANYAVEGFEAWKADAVTISPYMGSDSVGPFTEYCNNEKGKGVYILNRTSNPGAVDIQDISTDRGAHPVIYARVADLIIDWAKDKPGVGAVVGATSLDELTSLAGKYAGKDIPLLIPGVGGQGGKADEVAARLRDADYDLSLARINSSSGLTHPWKKQPAPEDYAKVCVEELNKLNEAIGYKP